MAKPEKRQLIDFTFEDLIRILKDSKPGDKSHIDRRYAILLTEVEKSYAYFNTYIMQEKNWTP